MRDLPHLGVGLGYRVPLHDDIIAHAERIDFLEFISDQYLYAPQEKTDQLAELAGLFPLIPHGVGMSIGTAEPISPDYLRRLASLVNRVDAPWFSDHLSFTKVPDTDIEQLMPLWFTSESLATVRRNMRDVGEVLAGRQFLLENITYYFPLPGNEMTEAEFVTSVLHGTETGLLLDINNVYVNSVNLGFDPYEFLDSIPLERTVQIHLAGGRYVGDTLVDTHSAPVPERAWEMLAYVLDRVPVKAILVEWDQDWPEFGVLLDHLDRARALMRASRKTRERL